ncbi:MAG: cytochrome c oxidase subunit 3 family protein [Candidatus Aminicenantales bacterium]
MTTKRNEEPIDYPGKKIGMWFFLFTELLFFGGVFLLYSIYRYRFPADFHRGAQEENLVLGSVNTGVLLTSSLFMALAVRALRRGRSRLSIAFQGATISLGAVFLVIKGFEWGAKIAKGIYPNGPALLRMSNGGILFFGLYYTMTGLHALHVAIGIALIAFMVRDTRRRVIDERNFARLENTGLYWHFVDIIWIYLFPLFYLIT